MASRQDMDAALKAIVIPRLKEMGFTGSVPHLRREREGVFDLVTFQFNKHGGSLCVELAQCLPTGIDRPLGHVPAKKARAWDRHPNYRKRLGRNPDGWFSFADEKAVAVAEIVRDQISHEDIWNGLSPVGSETPYRAVPSETSAQDHR